MMRRIALDGLRTFLGDVEAHCQPGTDLTALLRGQRFSQEQVAVLRQTHLDAFVEACRALIRTRLLLHHDGERLYGVLERHYGLDGAAPATLAAIGVDLGVSRARARQLQDKAVAYCRRRGMAWPESLAQIAAPFVGEPASRADGVGGESERRDRAGDDRDRPVGDVGTGVEGGSSPTLLPLYTREEIGVMSAEIEGQVGQPLTHTLIARVLVGQTTPDVEALVVHHNLPHYGALKGVPRRDVGRLIDVLRAPSRPAPAPRPDVADTREQAAPLPDPDVAPLVVAIRATTTDRIGTTMVAHILFGSQGPRVNALRERCHPPHDGALRALGIKRVVELVRAVDAVDGRRGTLISG